MEKIQTIATHIVNVFIWLTSGVFFLYLHVCVCCFSRGACYICRSPSFEYSIYWWHCLCARSLQIVCTHTHTNDHMCIFLCYLSFPQLPIEITRATVAAATAVLNKSTETFVASPVIKFSCHEFIWNMLRVHIKHMHDNVRKGREQGEMKHREWARVCVCVCLYTNVPLCSVNWLPNEHWDLESNMKIFNHILVSSATTSHIALLPPSSYNSDCHCCYCFWLFESMCSGASKCVSSLPVTTYSGCLYFFFLCRSLFLFCSDSIW